MTVRDLIEKAFRTIKVLGAGEHLADDESTDALDALNGIIEQANLDKLMGSYQTTLTIPMVGGQTAYTVGPASSTPHVTATRPVEILSGYSRRQSTDAPIFVGAKQDYDAITRKDISTGTWESMVYYEATFPKGTLYFYPVPADALTTVYLTVMNDLSSYTTLDDVVSLPPGYRVWLQYKLGMRMAPEYGMTFTADMVANLLDAEGALKRNNIKPMPVAKTGLTALQQARSGAYDIYSDTVKS